MKTKKIRMRQMGQIIKKAFTATYISTTDKMRLTTS